MLSSFLAPCHLLGWSGAVRKRQRSLDWIFTKKYKNFTKILQKFTKIYKNLKIFKIRIFLKKVWLQFFLYGSRSQLLKRRGKYYWQIFTGTGSKSLTKRFTKIYKNLQKSSRRLRNNGGYQKILWFSITPILVLVRDQIWARFGKY